MRFIFPDWNYKDGPLNNIFFMKSNSYLRGTVMYSMSNMDFIFFTDHAQILQCRSDGTENIDACWSDMILIKGLCSEMEFFTGVHLHTARKIPFMYSFPGNCGASVPICMYMFLLAIYIFLGSINIFPCRPILEIYKSLTDIWV